jgi:NAD-dependent deacetylase
MFPSTLIDILAAATRVVVLTGAGISAESGIPTFREAQSGLWARYDPAELATPHAFQRDPKTVWEWYAWRRELIHQAQPNSGHLALTQWPALFPMFTLITQNVDGFHRLAGAAEVVELHGNIHRVKCAAQGHIIKNWSELLGTPPPCPQCGSLLRPDVVWFGESLDRDLLERAFDASREAEVFFSIGTSAQVQPAASLAVTAKQSGACLVEINPQVTQLTPLANFAFQAPSGTILLPLTQEVSSRRRSP